MGIFPDKVLILNFLNDDITLNFVVVEFWQTSFRKRPYCSGFGFLSGRLGLIDWFASLYPIGCRHI